MSGALGPVARRYWFADSAALAAIRDAEDPPEWDASDLPVTVFCLDDESHTELREILADDENVRLVDAREPGRLSDILAAELDREMARHLQFAFRAIEDFRPALDLVSERLQALQRRALCTDMLAIGPYNSEQAAADLPERTWIPFAAIRDALAGKDIADIAALKAAVAELIETLDCAETKLIAGACYLTADEIPVLTGAEREAAVWRARTAAAWSEIDRLRSEKRVRAGREKALAARHERDLTRQAERSRREIDRLHRAAGWPGRWRARLTRLFGK